MRKEPKNSRCRSRLLAILLAAVCCQKLHAADDTVADTKPLPANSLILKCTKAQLWDQGSTSVTELTGPVQITLDQTTMSAEGAVVWISPNPSGPPDSHRVLIALIGRAKLQQRGVLRMDRKLLVNATVTGNLQLIGDRAIGADESSNLYLQAKAMREPATTMTAPTTEPTTNPTTEPATQSSTQPGTTTFPGALAPLRDLGASTTLATAPERRSLRYSEEPGHTTPDAAQPDPALRGTSETGVSSAQPSTAPAGTKTVLPPPGRVIEFSGDYEQATTSDGSIAAVCTNGVNLRYRDAKQNLLEFAAHDMVLITNLKQLKGAGSGEDAKHFMADHIVAAYFDGDVQVYATPAGGSKNELRMRAERVYYEFDTDRAIMTDVLFHTVDLKKQIPLLMRASKLRQLSTEEFKLQNVELSSSAFATPTYSIAASDIYVRGQDSGDPTVGERMSFKADNVTVHAVGVPIFYFPSVGGTMDSKGTAFRTAEFVSGNQYGTGLRTRWGLFETLGQIPPKDLDVTYSLDYLSKRGPAGGIDATYAGGFVSDTTKQPWNFLGDFHGYVVDDRGTDILGAARTNEKPEDPLRGRVYFEHQHFFPDDWQAQLRLGYISDSNFMPQWFNDEYQNNLPINDSFYIKHAKDQESFSFLAEAQPNRAISSADEVAQNKEISRLPEVTYYRVGDSIADDHLTFFSENSGSALKFVRNTQSLTQQGFYPQTEPGLPTYAYTGDSGRTVYRGDLREELDYPIDAGPFKVVPYVFTRFTPYSAGVVPPTNNPQRKTLPTVTAVSGERDRLMGGVGARLTTQFWKVDNTVESDIFDLHRLRHVVEPELNVFASASNIDQDRLFIYDPNVDAVNDVQAVQVALRQQWQTKRGGPGRWRSVDFFTLDLYGNFFANQPANRFRDPTDFRGLFFSSNPETSIPRNSANADASCRISDTMTILSSVEENLDKCRLASASVGVAVSRDARLSYFIGTRYIADLHSNRATLELSYQLDRKYSLSASESLDLAQNKDVYYTFALTRNFDNFSASVRTFYDQSTHDNGFSFSIQPFGGTKPLGSDQVTRPH